MNLVVNARDAMPAGGDLWLKTQVTVFDEAAAIQSPPAREGTFLCLTVADTGTGIAEDDLPHIFEPFFTTKEVGQGSGLGLATVYGIIQQHRGWITVSTEAGRGTTFHVYLPTTPDAVVEHPATTAASPKGGGETILVVEDEGAVRDLVREILIRQGYQVLVAENTPGALDVWHSNNKQIDLLLTDLVMPGQLSGRDLAVLLRAERPELRIIFTSGYSREAKAIELDAIPGAYFLGKPYPPAKLASLVRQCLDQGE
ncbi:MAG TPA: ATP-binding protein, partial [Candidatus Limnocylindria bacterium]|nr:ATP-binding protein [Candidatus Limnocylindria bacterium]